MGNFVTIDPTRIYGYIATDYKWLVSNDSYSVCVPVTIGKRYALYFETTDSTLVSTIFRFGFSSTNTPSGQTLTNCVRGNPQSTNYAQTVADSAYLVIQLGASKAESSITNGYLRLYQFDSSETMEDMGRLVERRRVLFPNYLGYEWDYTMGLPTANGWSLGKSGTTGQTIVSDGLKLTTSTSSSYCYYRPPSPYNATSGALEAVFKLTHSSSGTGSGYLRLCFSNGTKGCNVIAILSTDASQRGLYIYDDAYPLASTKIADISLGVFNKVRVELNDGYGAVYLNGVLVRSGIDVSTLYYSANTSFWWQGAGTTNDFATVQSVIVRVGEI